MVRFQNGTPIQVWFSQHGFGEAFTYDCLEKQGVRPVTYSGNGSHANYAINGTHDHTIPNVNLPDAGILTDYTDQGTLWDPLLGAYFYSYDASANTYTAYDSSYPTACMYISKLNPPSPNDFSSCQTYVGRRRLLSPPPPLPGRIVLLLKLLPRRSNADSEKGCSISVHGATNSIPTRIPDNTRSWASLQLQSSPVAPQVQKTNNSIEPKCVQWPAVTCAMFVRS